MANQKSQVLAKAQRDALFEYAHDHRTSMAAVVASVVERIAAGDAVPPREPDKDAMVELKYTPPARHSIALERARQVGVSLQLWVQQELTRLLDGEGK